MKVLAFDLFGTVFDLQTVDHTDLNNYAKHLKDFKETQEWKPLEFPQYWEHLPLFPSAKDGLDLLKKKFFVVTFSNAPLAFQMKLLANADIEFHSKTGLEHAKVYKPDPKAYLYLRYMMGGKGFKADEVMVVTGNKNFGDLEGAKEAGMNSYWLKDHNLFRLYEDLVNDKID